tara:strand:- start:1725 stop:2057 length:333 start_codon:yes stop_codon:yes gene_type:complete
MKIENKGSYTLFITDENIIKEALNNFFSNVEKHSTENIIFDISNNLNIKPEDFLLFLNIASAKKENGTSFVIIVRSLNIDALPEEINVVPTLQEAEDILEMENIERELGF